MAGPEDRLDQNRQVYLSLVLALWERVRNSASLLEESVTQILPVLGEDQVDPVAGLHHPGEAAEEAHDLWISKMVAGRPKDLEFCQALLKTGLVEPEELTRRLMHLEVDEAVRARIGGKTRVWNASARR